MITRYPFVIIIFIALSMLGGFISPFARPVYAAGIIRRLTGISASMDRMEAQAKQEGINYERADTFLTSETAKQEISQKELKDTCGEPVAKADNGLRWIYKPPTSTFFKGEKIYFRFNHDRDLIGWEKIYQK
jgi:hypothetical protein